MWYGTSDDLTEPQLHHPTTAYSEQELVQTADPVNVRLRGVHVSESHDLGWNTNDLMVVVTFQFDNQPPVDRLLYLEHGLEPGWYDDFFDDVVLSTNDFTYSELTLNVQVYDVDNHSLDPKLVDSVKRLVDEASSVVTYIPLARYAEFVDVALEPLVTAANVINDHDPIIDNRIRLSVDEQPDTGHDLLQPGYFVCFQKGVDIDPADGYRLNRDTKVVGPDDDVYTENSYVVLDVEREHVQTGSTEISQKASKLLSELDGRGQTDGEAIDYLHQTLEGYNNYKKVERVTELMAKESLTESEQALVDRLLSDEAVRDMLETTRDIDDLD